MEYFKVVSCFNDMLVSYNTSTFKEKNLEKLACGALVEYKIGEWIRPKILGSNLFVYESLDQARYMSQDNYYPALVFRCEVENPSYEGYWTGLSIDINELALRMKIREKMNILKYIHDSVMRHTVFCDAVKLLEQV